MTNGRKFDKPGVYQIRVNGVLDQKWSDWFGSFSGGSSQIALRLRAFFQPYSLKPGQSPGFFSYLAVDTGSSAIVLRRLSKIEKLADIGGQPLKFSTKW